MRVTYNEHNLSIIGAFVEHNRKMFGAVQHSITGKFLSIIGSVLMAAMVQMIVTTDYYNNLHALIVTQQILTIRGKFLSIIGSVLMAAMVQMIVTADYNLHALIVTQQNINN